MKNLLFCILVFVVCLNCDPPNPPNPTLLLAINVGENDAGYLLGVDREIDKYTTSNPNAYYRSGRKWLLGHSIPIANGSYKIRLYMNPPAIYDFPILEVRTEKDLPIIINTAESIFPIAFDMYTTVTDGQLDIRWLSPSTSENATPFLSGIEIYSHEPVNIDPYTALGIDCSDSVDWFNAYDELNDADKLNQYIKTAHIQGWKYTCIPPGEYRLDKKLIIRNGIKLYGYGATLIYTNHSTAIDMQGTVASDTVTLQGFTIDSDPLPYTQGTVIAVVDEGDTVNDRREVIVEIDEGYLDPSEYQSFHDAKTYFVFENGTFSRKSNGWGYTGEFETIDGYLHLRKLHPSDMCMFFNEDTGEFQENLRLVFELNGDGKGGIHPLFMRGIINYTELTINSCISSSIHTLISTAQPTYKWVVIEPGPMPENATQPRLLSSNRDSFHNNMTRGNITILGCTSKFNGDDGVNSSGNVYVIDEFLSPNSAYIHSRRSWPSLEFVYEAGDNMRLLDGETKEILDETRLLYVQQIPNLPDDPSNGFFRYYEIIFLDPIDVDQLPDDVWIDFENQNGMGTTVMYNIFGPNRANGVLMNGSNAVIQGNIMMGNTQHGIKTRPDFEYWKACGWTDNNKYVHNQILNPNEHGILIDDEGQTLLNLMYYDGVHSNLTIKDNYIEGTGRDGINLNALDNLDGIYDNEFVNIGGDDIYVMGE